MNILLTADLQFSDNPRDAYRFEFLEHTLPILIKKRGISIVLILGDLTEEKDRHPATLVNRIVRGLHDIAQTCSIVILQGNHDFNFDAENPFFAFLSRIERIRWIQTITRGSSIKISNSTIDKILGPSIFLPYTRDHKRDWNDTAFKNFDVVFAHNTFTGANAGHGHIMKGISTDVFAKNNTVFAGDVHTPHDVGPVTYVGAPYLCDFGDDYKPRVLLVDKTDIISIPVKGPNKRLLKIDANFRVPKGTELNPGDILKVEVELNKAEYDGFPEFRDRIYAWGEKSGYVIHMIQPKVTMPMTRHKEPNRSRKLDDEALVKKYVKQQGGSEKMLKAGLRYLED